MVISSRRFSTHYCRWQVCAHIADNFLDIEPTTDTISDTTSTSLVYMFSHLAQQPEIVAKARDEVKDLWNEDGTFKHREASHSEYINGIINETLRMHPPVPSAILRCTPPEGLQIGNVYVPGNVNVWCPQYVLGRCKCLELESQFLHRCSHITLATKAYVDPNSFIPERWSTKPDLIKDKNAFYPFSLGMSTTRQTSARANGYHTGPMGCIGKPLALMELRCVLAKLITTFDVKFAPGDDGTDLDAKSRDHFTLEPGPLNLCFTARAATA